MRTVFSTQQQIDLFWNQIKISDESVQRGLFFLLNVKFGKKEQEKISGHKKTFLELKGVLKSKGSQESDKELLDEYLKEKYGA